MHGFDAAWEYLKQNEGGFSNNSADHGGMTNFGISLRFLQSLPLHDGDINNDFVIDANDIKDIPEEAARILYKKYFWTPAHCDQINSLKVAVKFFDMCVNLGIKKSVSIMQKILNNGLAVDGIIGPKTLTAVNSADPDILLTKLTDILVQTYTEIAENNQSQRQFLKGWIRRARRLPS